MITSLARHKLILIVIGVLVAGIAWYALSGTTSPSSSVVATPTTGTGITPANQDLVSTLLTLRTVKLDGTILNDPSFMDLKDFSTDIVPEPVGRTNPFAPLSSTASASASSTKSAQIFTPRR